LKLGWDDKSLTFPEAKVNLKNPDKTFICIKTDEKLVFGLKLTEISSKTSQNAVHAKTFLPPISYAFQTCTLHVNLAHAKVEEQCLILLWYRAFHLLKQHILGFTRWGLTRLSGWF
jgi:hypothetical protein